MKCLVISTSLSPESKSAILAAKAREFLGSLDEIEIDWMDLRDTALPFCDGGVAYGDQNVRLIKSRIEAADGLLVATPIYNYGVSASAKNLLELTGSAWRDKTVGFLCAAGGRMSYMSVMHFANSLMLDYRCTIVPDFVYAHEEDFEGENLIDDQVEKRLKHLAKKFSCYVKALAACEK